MSIKIVLSVLCISLLAASPDTVRQRTSGSSFAFTIDATKEPRTTISVDPLSGIPAVFVSTIGLSRNTLGLSLSRSEIERLIVDELVERGIPLFRKDETPVEKAPKTAMLSVNVRALIRSETVAYDVTLSLNETLLQQHDRDVFVSAPI